MLKAELLCRRIGDDDPECRKIACLSGNQLETQSRCVEYNEAVAAVSGVDRDAAETRYIERLIEPVRK